MPHADGRGPLAGGEERWQAMSGMLKATALILSDDARDPNLLQSLLAASGYVAYSVEPVDTTVERTLHETRAALVVAHVDLKRDTLAQPHDVAVLGLLLREPSYTEQHAVLVLTRTPDVVDTVLGPVLERLGVPVLALPYSLDDARAAVTMACAHLHMEGFESEPRETIGAGAS